MATKQSIAYRRAEALKSIDESLGGVFEDVPAVRDAEMRLVFQLEAIAKKVGKKEEKETLSADYPEDFPHRELLEPQKDYLEVLAMNEKELVSLDGIGRSRAKDILKYKGK